MSTNGALRATGLLIVLGIAAGCAGADATAGGGGGYGAVGDSGVDSKPDTIWDGAAAGPASLDPSRRVSDLSASEQGLLCDWMASLFGGYNYLIQCGWGSVRISADQAKCVAESFPAGCTITVKEYADCQLARLSSSGCDLPPEFCRQVITC